MKTQVYGAIIKNFLPQAKQNQLLKQKYKIDPLQTNFELVDVTVSHQRIKILSADAQTWMHFGRLHSEESSLPTIHFPPTGVK